MKFQPQVYAINLIVRYPISTFFTRPGATPGAEGGNELPGHASAGTVVTSGIASTTGSGTLANGTGNIDLADHASAAATAARTVVTSGIASTTGSGTLAAGTVVGSAAGSGSAAVAGAGNAAVSVPPEEPSGPGLRSSSKSCLEVNT